MSGKSETLGLIAHLRAESKHLRELAAAKRELVRELKGRPIGKRDPLALLAAQDRVAEYVGSAKRNDERCRELREQIYGRIVAVPTGDSSHG